MPVWLCGQAPHTLRHAAIIWAMRAGEPLADAAGFFGVSIESLEGPICTPPGLPNRPCGRHESALKRGFPGGFLAETSTGQAWCPCFIGRSERIRTSGPCLPKTVLYQAELHSVSHASRVSYRCALAIARPIAGASGGSIAFNMSARHKRQRRPVGLGDAGYPESRRAPPLPPLHADARCGLSPPTNREAPTAAAPHPDLSPPARP